MISAAEAVGKNEDVRISSSRGGQGAKNVDTDEDARTVR